MCLGFFAVKVSKWFMMSVFLTLSILLLKIFIFVSFKINTLKKNLTDFRSKLMHAHIPHSAMNSLSQRWWSLMCPVFRDGRHAFFPLVPLAPACRKNL